MVDGVGRTIDYLRISVTDKCNLRCQYCMPKEGIKLMPHEALLTLEEITRVCHILAEMGIKKIRITGGEPLVRKNIGKLIADIHAIPQIEDVAITTNGVLFAPMAEELHRAGLDRVNLSLDTRDGKNFAQITGKDELAAAEQAMESALEQGMTLKINCVPCRQLNDADVVAVAQLAKERPVDVRFIELMPIGCGASFDGIPSEEILRRLEAVFGEAEAVAERRGNGPAEYYSFEGFQGKIGFISPLSHKFCDRCNRVRLTAEGRLKLCLHYDHGIDLRELLRDETMDNEHIRERIIRAVAQKPEAHHFEGLDDKDADKRKMYQIGG
ncbi:MAG: GTP 3',8-cyclase MoaA [Acetatifactor sp.]|nr:GTP 3',8-cyclase MoaA [Acetatifactor sp.]